MFFFNLLKRTYKYFSGGIKNKDSKDKRMSIESGCTKTKHP